MTLAGQASGAGRVSADRERCVGAGQCVLAAPAVFDQDEDDGLVHVLVESPSVSQADAVRDAVRACPSGALTLRQSAA
ncbi:ferredoxin [Streptomyces sp. WAC04189]|uniref:Ferredoxin n=1 Tax=Streptomyces rochei TaxID=1928 RepID=A0ABW7E9H6_STRRO|nr:MULTISPECIES: ferredoxin [Streptomyces]GGY79563.1 ferredoxin [Streptomyces geysiriensis]KYK13134.1 ferredoxin [Streptomyces sp. CC71]MBU8553683.1 ferredoxin [Streptomyces sp. Osf17]MBU8560475.1 ferredoxin [Streptomyces sp. Babs14]RSS04527.1 ferredoxin [Streptomyces sp. WAC04189]